MLKFINYKLYIKICLKDKLKIFINYKPYIN